MMSAECCTEKQQHNLMVDEEEVGKIRAELEIAVEKVTYFNHLIIAADNLRKLAEAKIIETQSKKLELLSNKLDSQIQSISELIRKAETKKDEAINNVLDAEVNLIVLENRILHAKVINF
jgi:hypothetical protein